MAIEYPELHEPSDDWRECLLARQPYAIATALAAVARIMLPYWEALYTQDDQYARIVSATSEWVTNPTGGATENLRHEWQRVAHDREGFFYLSPVDQLPRIFEHPADYAGSSIAAAALAILEIKSFRFRTIATVCVSDAVETLAQQLGHRNPEDEETDFWSEAQERLRVRLLGELRTATTA